MLRIFISRACRNSRAPVLPLPLLLLAVPAALHLPPPTHGQEPYRPSSLTAQDYARAERFLAAGVRDLVYGTSVSPNWVGGGRFWYRNAVPGGHEFVLVDPGRGRRQRAFDHERLARAIQDAGGGAFTPLSLPLTGLDFTPDGRTLRFQAEGHVYTCDLGRHTCQREAAAPIRTPSGPRPGPRAAPAEVRSPDGAKAAFIRDHNLWVRDLRTGEETQLTRDGTEDFGYATDNAGWTRSDRPVLAWSTDSKKIATFQHDARGVGMMYLTSTRVGRPELEAWKYPLPEDTVIFRIHRVIIHLEGPGAPRVVRLKVPPDQHRSGVCDHVFCGGAFADVEWAPDGSTLAFVSTSRDHKEAAFRVADSETGEVRTVLVERAETFLETGNGTQNWRYLPESDELIWWSERSDWGHLYLYDLSTGNLKRALTGGPWLVWQVRHLDRKNRMVYFTGMGRERGDPYFHYFYSLSLDGGDLRLLTPDSAHHVITLSPDASYFVDAASTPTNPGRIVVRDMAGRERVMLEKGDISRLVEQGWEPPIPFVVKARDGITDLHGLLYKPTHLDPTKKYPVVNYLYPGPQSGSVGSRSFNPARRDHQALAELGFVVVELDAMGTPGRSKSFHEFYYGNMGDNGLPDQIAGIRQLGRRYPWMDMDRVGIWGHSGGGFAAAAGILRYPDFYKVAVSQAGNHDNRSYEDDWGEKWQGLLIKNPDGTTNYDNQANQLLAHQLQGKLLLAHGTLDDNVPPYNTLLVVDALIAANKDFDLILFPNRRHGFGNEPYMMRRRWDYFVKHLLGAEPPPEYRLGGQGR